MNADKNMLSIRGGFKVAAGAMAGAPLAAQAMTLGPLSLALSPWMLMAIPATMALWWLRKNIPKTPELQFFPGITLLYNIKSEEQTPARSPWWELIPITLAAFALVGALAKPEWNQQQLPLEGTGPILMPVDNGWASARGWKARTEQMHNIIDRAERADRLIAILPTAASQDGSPVTLHTYSAAQARQMVNELTPHPWPVNREAAIKALKEFGNKQQTAIVWLSDGLTDNAATSFAETLQTFGKLTVIEDEKALAPRLLDQPSGASQNLTVSVRRSQTSGAENITLIATDEAGDALEQVEATLKTGESKTDVAFTLKPLMRNQVTSITIKGDNHAGARVLIDERFRRRPVGVIQTGNNNSGLSLASESHYVAEALRPYADLHVGTTDELLKRKLAVMVMADSASVSRAQNREIETWVQSGGTLVRFAGPRLEAQYAAATEDPLLPAKTREARELGTNVSGSAQGKLAPFGPKSPFSGLAIPDDISIKKQILLHSGADLDNDKNTWARLQDSTPLVTARNHGSGQIVLVHTAVDPAWANMNYSGLFVEMLRKIVATSQGVGGKLENGELSLPPDKIMDAQGRMTVPHDAVQPLTAKAITESDISPRHPPGFYGSTDMKQAHNLSVAVPELKALGDLPGNPTRKIYEAGKKDADLTGYMLAGTLAFVLMDMSLMLWQRRGTRRQAPNTAAPAAPAPGQ